MKKNYTLLPVILLLFTILFSTTHNSYAEKHWNVNINAPKANQTPKPEIVLNPANGIICGTTGTVELTAMVALDVSYPDGSIYTWYKNGTEITGENDASITVDETGIDTYTVIVVQETDSPSELSEEVEVKTESLPAISITDYEPKLCIGESVTFEASITGEAFFEWISENPAIAEINAATGEVTALSAGTVKIYCKAISASGCPHEEYVEVTINANPSFTFDSHIDECESFDISKLTPSTGSLAGLTMTYYDDNNTELSSTIITISGTYYITGIDNIANCEHTESVVININPLPVINDVAATFLFPPNPIYTYEFEADITGNITDWEWTFGDGGTDNLAQPTYQYVSAGTYTVTLKVTTDKGCSAETLFQVIIQTLDVDFVVDNDKQCLADNYFSFTNQSQLSDSDGLLDVAWEWDFGDGSTNDEENAAHSYANSGTYTVKLTGVYMGIPTSYSIQVTVVEMPVVNPVENITVCNGEVVPEIKFTGSPAGTVFEWKELPGSGNIGQTATQGIGNMINGYAAVNNENDVLTVKYEVTPVFDICAGTPVYFEITILPKAEITLWDNIINTCGTDDYFELLFSGNGILPAFYSIEFEQAALDEGYSNITNQELSGNSIQMIQPLGIPEGSYAGKLFITFEDCGNYDSAYDFIVDVANHPVIVSQSHDSMICKEMAINIIVNALGKDLAFQWYRDGVEINGATSNEYSVPVDLIADSDYGVYHVEIISRCGIEKSDDINIVKGEFSIMTKWNDPILFVSNKNEAGNLIGYVAYQWYRNDEKIENAISQYYKMEQGEKGIYFVRAYYDDENYDESCPEYLGVSDGLKSVDVYPNPVQTNNNLHVDISIPNSNDETIILELFDMSGKLITRKYTGKMTSIYINMLPGIYILQISDSEKLIGIEKVIVRK